MKKYEVKFRLKTSRFILVNVAAPSLEALNEKLVSNLNNVEFFSVNNVGILTDLVESYEIQEIQEIESNSITLNLNLDAFEKVLRTSDLLHVRVKDKKRAHTTL